VWTKHHYLPSCSTPSFHAYDIYLHSSYETGTYRSKKIEVDRCELHKQETAYSQSRARSSHSPDGQYNNKRDTLANTARMTRQDISQTASLPSIAAGGSDAEVHQACKMILVARFSNLVKKRHRRYTASTKDLEGYICGRPEEHQKECAKVESRGLFQYPYHKTSIDGLFSATTNSCASSDERLYLPTYAAYADETA
jgi:hypothetical protein